MPDTKIPSSTEVAPLAGDSGDLESGTGVPAMVESTLGGVDVEVPLDGDVAGDMDSKNQKILEPVAPSRELTLSFESISGWVPAFGVPGAKKAEGAPEYRQILHGISGQCSPGEVVALMGPSGSGKTTLLSVLGGRTPGMMRQTGTLQFNGAALSKSVKRRMGFVLQDDLLFDALTVTETLYFAALLRLPRNMSKEEKLGRVESVIQTLGLTRCRDTIIGGPFRRGVSGGERKRVSVGHELLINPSTLLLDEPTSGLDSTTAMNLITTLKQLAQGGRSVITTIHQPSSRLYQRLDKLLLLSQGHALYYGDAQQVHAWFSHLNFPVPYGVNTADYILDLANGDFVLSKEQMSAHGDGEACRSHLIRVAEAFAPRHKVHGFLGPQHLPALDEALSAEASGEKGAAMATTAPPKSGGMLQKMASSLKSLNSMKRVGSRREMTEPQTPTTVAAATQEEEKPSHRERWGASWGGQVNVLLQRNCKTRRFDALSGQKTVQVCVVALCCGMFWFQRGSNESLQAANDMAGLVFFEMLFMAFSSMFAALFTFPSEFRMLLKERASGMYRLSAFYVARTLADLPMDCALPSAFVFILYWFSGLRVTPGAFFANWGIIMLIVLTAQSYGLLIGAVVMNPKTGQTLTTIIMLAFMLVGGFYIRDIPVWIGWIKYFSFIFWGYSALTKVEFKDRAYYDCDSDNSLTERASELCPQVDDLEERLRLPRDLNESAALECGVLLGMLFLLRLAVYRVLKHKTSKV